MSFKGRKEGREGKEVCHPPESVLRSKVPTVSISWRALQTYTKIYIYSSLLLYTVEYKKYVWIHIDIYRYIYIYIYIYTLGKCEAQMGGNGLCLCFGGGRMDGWTER
jgi:hypothetical protein